MKKWLIPLCIAVVLIMGTMVVMTKETNRKYVINQEGGTFEYIWQTNTGIQPSGQIVKIPLDQNTVRLENRLDINLRQSCAAMEPSIEIDSTLLAELDQDLLKQGIIASKKDIVISKKMPEISVKSGIPIQAVSNQGRGNLLISCPDRAQFSLSNFGTGDVSITDNYLKSAEIQNRGTGNILFYEVGRASVDNRGTGKVSFKKVDEATVDLYGVGDVSFGNSPKITSTIKGLGTIKTNSTPSK